MNDTQTSQSGTRAHGPVPDLAYEQLSWSAGQSVVAGIDEVGRGAWAGPVVATAVILPASPALLTDLDRVRDSKMLTPLQRERVAETIRHHALHIGIGLRSAHEIDAIGLGPAMGEVFAQAVTELGCTPQHLLLDGKPFRRLRLPHTAIVHGDACCLSIAAASIIAKVTRDRMMRDLHLRYPQYGFAAHKGYGTAAHQAALREAGPCPEHRLSVAPVASVAAALGLLPYQHPLEMSDAQPPS